MRQKAMGKVRSATALGAICAALGTLGAAPSLSGAAAPEPDFVFFAEEKAEPGGDFEGPCGLAVDSGARFYVADYYNHAINVYTPFREFQARLTNVDPLDGPCGLAVAEGGALYANNYHRNVEKFVPAAFPPFKTTKYTSAGIIDDSHPTGVAVDPASNEVYVNARTHVAVYDASGAPVMDGGEPLQIGEGAIENGYGLALSSHPATAGYVYVPDAGDDTVKVFDPATDTVNPVATIDGADTPAGEFGSLRDSAVAVDRVTGEVYVADTRGLQLSEHPEATIQVFDSAGTYKGRLKYNVVDASPPGLAVDNTSKPTKGRVYVTSGNGPGASVYAYPPGSATSLSAPAAFSLSLGASGSGGGQISSEAVGIACEASCAEQVRAGSQISLTATPDAGSAFTGWSGGCEGTGECVVAMSEARSVGAEFTEMAGPVAPPSSRRASSSTATPSTTTQKGTLRIKVSGSMAPKRLPRDGAAPISVSVGGQISTTDKSLPPQLKKMRIELNKEGRLDYQGLPPCNYPQIQPGSSQRALSACKESLVGEGSFTADITLAGQEPYPTTGKLLVFYSKENGKPVLYGHIYSPKPFATSFVIVFKVQRLGKGTYGTALDAPLPAAMDAWGRLTGLEMTLSRRYTYKGKARSFISSGCPAPKGFSGATFPLAKTEFSFAGGKKLSSVLSSSCKARG